MKNDLKKSAVSFSLSALFARKLKLYTMGGVLLFRLVFLMITSIGKDTSSSDSELLWADLIRQAVKEFFDIYFSGFIAAILCWLTGVTIGWALFLSGFLLELFVLIVNLNEKKEN